MLDKTDLETQKAVDLVDGRAALTLTGSIERRTERVMTGSTSSSLSESQSAHAPGCSVPPHLHDLLPQGGPCQL